jgi:mono/diheme cytochrome c family protein
VRLPSQVDLPFADAYEIEALNRTGVLAASPWITPAPAGLGEVERQAHDGAQVFRLECQSCHSVDSYLAVRPLVQGRSVDAIDATIRRLAAPVDASGQPAAWKDPGLRLATWRDRHMPPFAGTEAERRALAVHLALVGGATPESLARPLAAEGAAGPTFFEANCSMCHGADSEWPMTKEGRRSADEFYELLGRLPEVNEMMPPFPGNDAERRAVAEHLATLTASNPAPKAEGSR